MYPEKDLYAKLTQNKTAGRLNESYEDTFKEIEMTSKGTHRGRSRTRPH